MLGLGAPATVPSKAKSTKTADYELNNGKA